MREESARTHRILPVQVGATFTQERNQTRRCVRNRMEHSAAVGLRDRLADCVRAPTITDLLVSQTLEKIRIAAQPSLRKISRGLRALKRQSQE